MNNDFEEEFKIKHNHYIVTFENGRTVFVGCFNEEEAEILAKAVMIESGLTREVKSIVKTNDLSKRKFTNFII